MTVRDLLLACTFGAIAACAPSAAHAQSSKADDDGPPIDCKKVFAPADAVGILNDPAIVGTYPYRSGSCTFSTAKDGGSIIVYGGPDMTSEMTWNDVTASSDKVKYTALSGVGDQAVRKAKDGAEIESKKGRIYCTVVLPGFAQSGTDKDFTSARGEALAKRLGALCNKYFAMR